MVKVLVSDKLSPRAVEIFRDRGIEVDFKTGMTPAEIREIIGQYDGLAIRSATKATAELIEAAGNLKVIGRAGIGVDNVDLKAATAKGVVVMNTPFGNAITTAEHAIAMMFAVARQIPQANESTHAGKWEKSKFMGVELTGKTLGVIGCGNIGSIAADRAVGLKMKVLAYDPFLSAERAVEIGVQKVTLEQLLEQADFITLHTPLTDQTRNIIDADAIARMKPGVRIVNCARGGLVDEAALKTALESGHVAGAAFDVFVEEPAKENALFGLPNFIATPHLGAATTEAQENVALQVAEQMSDYLLTGAVTNALNMPSVTAEEAPRLKPYMKLAELLGSFAGQLTESALRSVQIEYAGHVAELNTKPLTALALQGLLAPLMSSVNMVNAPIIAKERDIACSETRTLQAPDYQTLIRITVTTEKQTRSVAGTLLGASPRIVEIKEIDIEAHLAPSMLYITNHDKPGLIGELGKVLGDNGVNIATFHLGRVEVGSNAIALLEIDGEISEDVLKKVRAIEHVVQAKPLKFDI